MVTINTLLWPTYHKAINQGAPPILIYVVRSNYLESCDLLIKICLRKKLLIEKKLKWIVFKIETYSFIMFILSM